MIEVESLILPDLRLGVSLRAAAWVRQQILAIEFISQNALRHRDALSAALETFCIGMVNIVSWCVW
jgi:hypothetical protein